MFVGVFGEMFEVILFLAESACCDYLQILVSLEMILESEILGFFNNFLLVRLYFLYILIK